MKTARDTRATIVQELMVLLLMGRTLMSKMLCGLTSSVFQSQ
jgi:hypothetical protein